MDETVVADVASLLHETAQHHDGYEKVAPPHRWWDWYAAYFVCRQSGRPPEEAEAFANDYMAQSKGIVIPG